MHTQLLCQKKSIREAEKKCPSLNGRAIKALPPSPLGLNGHRSPFSVSLYKVNNSSSTPIKNKSYTGSQNPKKASVRIMGHLVV